MGSLKIIYLVLYILYVLHLQIRLTGSEWSFPFFIDEEEIMNIIVRHNDGQRQSIRLDVHGHEGGSRFLAIFQLGSSRGPYRYVQTQLLKTCTSLVQFSIHEHFHQW